MATTEQTADKTPADKAEDADEIIPTGAEDSLAVAGDGEYGGQSPARSAGPRIDSRRQAAIEEYHRLRAAREAAEREADAAAARADAGEEPADGNEGAADPPPMAAAPAQQVKARPATPPPAEADEPTYTLVVDGKPVTMKASEVIAKAQIAVASDNRLDEAKRLLAEAKALRSQAPSPEHRPDDGADESGQSEQPTQPRRAPPNQARAIDKEKLRNIVSRIQVGDDEEGADAAAELASEIAASMAQPDVARVVDETIRRRTIQSEIQTAAQSFQTTYAGIVQDQDLLDMSFAKLRAKVREDLVAAGEDPATLTPMNGEQLFELHQQRRAQGVRVRDYNRIFSEVGQEMAAKFASVLQTGQPAAPAPTQQPTTTPSASLADRVERKRSATPQPRAAGVRTQTQPTYRPKTREQVVAEMRRQRGFR